MTTTITRPVSQNLFIQSVVRRPDQLVVITFTLLRAGVWQSVRPLCVAKLPGFPNGIVMTPAVADPQHSRDLIFAPMPGMTFRFVWNAPLDGYGTGTLNGITFQVSYTDIYCCEEIESDPERPLPPGPPPPVPPVPGGGIPPGGPPPGGPAAPPQSPFDPRLQPVAGSPSGAAGGQSPTPPAPPGGFLSDPRGYPTGAAVPVTGPTIPVFGPGFAGGVTYDANGNRITAPPPSTPEPFPYQQVQDVSKPGVPQAVGTQPPVAPGSTQIVLGPSGPVVDTLGLGEPPVRLPYPLAPQFVGYFGTLSNTTNGLTLVAFVPVAAMPESQRSNLYWAVYNGTPAAYSPASVLVLGRGSDMQVRVLAEAAFVEVAPNPPGTLPPFRYGGNVVCIDWSQFPAGPASFLVMLLNAQGFPIAGVTVAGAMMPSGSAPSAGLQTPEYLGPGTRAIANFPAQLQPAFEGSVNAVGDEDTFIFTARHSTVAVVVQATAEAIALGFQPKLSIYDVNDMATPVATSMVPFVVGDAEIEPELVQAAWKGSLTIGNKYAIVVQHVTGSHYSRRWGFRIFHDETTQPTGGTFTIDGLYLAGEISCAYGRQEIALLNDRTGQIIYVKTNDIGVSFDIQLDSHSGSDGKLLAAVAGDEIEVIRPGPGVLYRRDADLIGEASV